MKLFILFFVLFSTILHTSSINARPDIFSYLDKDETFLLDLENYLKTLPIEKRITVVNQEYRATKPLAFALQNKKFSFAELLVNYGADVNALDDQGNNSVLEAALALVGYGGSTEIINILIQNGASTKITNRNGETLQKILEENMMGVIGEGISEINTIFVAIDGKHAKQITQMLKDYPECLNQKNKNGDTPLLYTLKQKNEGYALSFIGAGADLVATDNDGNTALHIATEHGYVDCVKKIIEQHPELINQKNNSGDTPLIKAAAGNHNDIITTFFKTKQVDPNIQGASGLSALHWAAARNNKALVSFLLQQGANIDLTSDYGSPYALAQKEKANDSLKVLQQERKRLEQENDIFKAIDAGNEDALKKIIQNNKNKLEIQNRDGDTPLLYCLKKGKTKLAKHLIAVPVDINAADKDGNTALHIAAQKSQATTLQRLLKKADCEVNAKNKDGITPLILAIKTERKQSINTLLKNAKGLLIDAQDANNKTALHYAVEKNNEELVNQLIQAGAFLNAKDSSGKTPLELAGPDSGVKNILQGHKNQLELESNIFYAIQTGNKDNKDNKDKIQELLRSNPSSLESTLNGNTPLLYCIKNNKPALALAFITSTPANCDATDSEGNTPLHWAAYYGYDDVVSALLNKNANPNATNNVQSTPLHIASNASKKTVVEQLLAKGAHSNAQDKNGNTALHIAAYWNNVDLIKLLSEDPTIDLNAQNHDHVTPFMLAAQYNKLEAAQALLNAGAFVDLSLNPDQFEKPIAELISAYKNYWDIFDALAKQDTKRIELIVSKDKNNLEKRDFHGNTPLLYCIKQDPSKYNVYTQGFIEGYHVNINATDADGNTPLHYAAGRGNQDITDLLLHKNASLNVLNAHHQTPLLIAVRNNQLASATAIANKDSSSINIQDFYGWSALHYAAKNNNTDLVKLLLEKGADAFVKNKDGQTAVDYSTDVTTKNVLLEHQIKIEQENDIFYAIQSNNFKRFQQLLNDPTQREKKYTNQTPLLYCLISKKQEQWALECIQQGADLNVVEEGRNASILHLAAYYGYLKVMQKALEKIAINIQDKELYTPLHYAVQGAQEDAVRLLIQNGAIVDSINKEDQTPLQAAAKYNLPTIVTLLIANNASLDSIDKDGKTPRELAPTNSAAKKILEDNDIFLAIDRDDKTMITSLAKNKHFLVRRRPDTNTPLLHAITQAKPDIAEILLDAAADPAEKNSAGYCALHYSVENGYAQLIEKILQINPATINEKTLTGQTPLHIAVMSGNQEIIELLLINQASTTIKNNAHKSPLELAQDQHKDALVGLMKSAQEPLGLKFMSLRFKLTRLKEKLNNLKDVLTTFKNELAA